MHNSSSRVTRWLNRAPTANLYHAQRYAQITGLDLTHFITLNLTACSILASGASVVFQRLLAQRFAPWLRRSARNTRGLPPTYIWVLEAPAGTVSAHWLVHVPRGDERKFERTLRGWLENLANDNVPVSAIDVRPAYRPDGARKYMSKGVNSVWAPYFRVEHINQGEITGKRSGFSRNLGPTARRDAGYKARRSFGLAPKYKC